MYSFKWTWNVRSKNNSSYVEVECYRKLQWQAGKDEGELVFWRSRYQRLMLVITDGSVLICWQSARERECSTVNCQKWQIPYIPYLYCNYLEPKNLPKNVCHEQIPANISLLDFNYSQISVSALNSCYGDLMCGSDKLAEKTGGNYPKATKIFLYHVLHLTDSLSTTFGKIQNPDSDERVLL